MSHADTTASPRFTDSRRSGAGLAVTIAVHAGVAALALAGWSFATAPTPPRDPIVTRHIPDPVIVPRVAAPSPVDQPINLDVPEPIVTIADPTPTEFRDPVLPDPGPLVSGIDLAPPSGGVSDPPPAPGPTTVARFDPRYAGNAQPPYPAAARRLGEEGSVIVHIRIGRDGRVIAVTLAQSSGSPRLDAAALAHAQAHWRFVPALQDGERIEASRDITVRFRLDQAA